MSLKVHSVTWAALPEWVNEPRFNSGENQQILKELLLTLNQIRCPCRGTSQKNVSLLWGNPSQNVPIPWALTLSKQNVLSLGATHHNWLPLPEDIAPARIMRILSLHNVPHLLGNCFPLIVPWDTSNGKGASNGKNTCKALNGHNFATVCLIYLLQLLAGSSWSALSVEAPSNVCLVPPSRSA